MKSKGFEARAEFLLARAETQWRQNTAGPITQAQGLSVLAFGIQLRSRVDHVPTYAQFCSRGTFRLVTVVCLVLVFRYSPYFDQAKVRTKRRQHGSLPRGGIVHAQDKHQHMKMFICFLRPRSQRTVPITACATVRALWFQEERERETNSLRMSLLFDGAARGAARPAGQLSVPDLPTVKRLRLIVLESLEPRTDSVDGG